ncbi:MAG: DUF5667 domain-containing protein, partial [Anaerolineales bacterium]
IRRNRAKLLQHAAELREAKVEAPLGRVWFASLRRVAVALILLGVLFASGTGLVGAASAALPGDNLYPVKRTWENVSLLFTVDLQKRASLEIEHENERLDELHELFVKGRSAKVDFAGRVTRQSGDKWLVTGFPVVISPETDMPDVPIATGAAVRVIGFTQGNNMVRAERVELLPPNASLPKGDEGINEGSDHSGKEGSGSGSENEAPEVEETETPEPRMESFDGILQSMDVNDIWTVNGIVTDVSNAEIIGTPVIGAAVIVNGYFNSNGVFIVTKIVFVDNSSNSGSGSNSNDDENTGGTDNENNNSNDNENSNVAENSNDSSGPGSGGGNDNGNDNNSGPGGGGDDNGNEDNSNSSGSGG